MIPDLQEVSNIIKSWQAVNEVYLEQEHLEWLNVYTETWTIRIYLILRFSSFFRAHARLLIDGIRYSMIKMAVTTLKETKRFENMKSHNSFNEKQLSLYKE